MLDTLHSAFRVIFTILKERKNKIMKSRIHYLDHLRTFAIFLVVVLHAGLVYEVVLENIWIVSDPEKNNSIGLIRMYLDLFVMFTIFFVSGYLIPISVQKKSTRQFLVSKVKRILVPWFIAVFTLIPAYKIIFLYSRGLPQEAWYSYFHLFQRSGTDWGYFSNNPTQNWLWFLPMLFTFQVLYLVLTKMKIFPLNISVKTGVILTVVIGVAYSMLLSNAGLTGWFHSGFFEFQKERLLPYFMVFLVGALCQQHHVFERDEKNKKRYIAANIGLTLGLGVFTAVALNLFFNLIEPGRNHFFISSMVDRTVYYFTALLSMFCFLYVMLYAFKHYFNKTNPLMNILNRNSYSVYIIHVLVLGVIAWPMMYVLIPPVAKFLILTMLTFVVSNFLVFAYDHLLQERLYLRIAIMFAFVVTFFAFTNSGNTSVAQSSEVKETTLQKDVVPPSVGLHEAALTGNMVAIRQHLQAGTDLNEKEASGGSSPLITAAVFGKTEVAIALINAGADVNFTNNEGSTALHSAAFFCHTEIVQALLKHAADPQIRNNAGSTALESVTAPFDQVIGIYDYFGQTLGPLGLHLDYERIQQERPKIEKLIRIAE